MQRRIKIVLLTWALLVVSQGVWAGYSGASPEKLAKSIHKILKKGDPAGFESLVLTDEDVAYILPQVGFSEEELSTVNQDRDAFNEWLIKEFKEGLSSSYEAFVMDCKSEQFDLKKSKIKEMKVVRYEAGELSAADITVILTDKRQDIELVIPSVTQLKTGWFMLMEEPFYMEKAVDIDDPASVADFMCRKANRLVALMEDKEANAERIAALDEEMSAFEDRLNAHHGEEKTQFNQQMEVIFKENCNLGFLLEEE